MNYLDLLKKMIETPSFSKEEADVVLVLEAYLKEKKIPFERFGNNLIARSKHWSKDKKTLLLNSHHDTVKPVKGWQRDPFKAIVEEGKLYGLGSNDAGASLVSLITTFEYFYNENNCIYNLILAATAEEEISGKQGIESILNKLGAVDLAIVGEPTQMRMAIAERGLMVIDGEAKGQSGHAARNEGINALYIAMEDIEKIKNQEFGKTSKLLGKTKATVTQIQAGYQHNVVPDSCKFVIDVRTNEHYSNEEVFAILNKATQSDLKARSFRLNPSGISIDHPLVQNGIKMGMETYGSPTLSDQALMPFPSLKLGPGASKRSHTADEFIYIHEMENGIQQYIQLLKQRN